MNKNCLILLSMFGFLSGLHAQSEIIFRASAEFRHGDDIGSRAIGMRITCFISNASSGNIRMVLPIDPAGAGCWLIKLTGHDGKAYRIGAAPPPPSRGPLVKINPIQSIVIPPRKSNTIEFSLDDSIWEIGKIPEGEYDLEIIYNPDPEFLEFYEKLGLIAAKSSDLNLRSESIRVHWFRS